MDRPKSLWILFLVLWAFTLFVYGAVSVWAIEVTVVAMALLYAASLILLPEPLKLSRAAVLFLAAMAGLFLVQLLPVGALLFPYTHRLRMSYGVGWCWPATADTFRTVLFIAQFSIYVMVALFVLKLRQAGLPGSFMLKTSLAVMGLEAAWGVIRVFANFDWIPFYQGPGSGPGIASGTLVGRNNFAGLLGMGIVIAAAFAWSRFTWPPRETEAAGAPSWTRRLEVSLGWALLSSLFAIGIVLSRSRGGALAALAGLVLLPFFHRGRASAAGAVTVVLIGVGAFVIANPTGLLVRFGAIDPFEISADSRWKMITTTFAAALHQPILGFGFGSHPVAYHPFQPPTVQGQIHHAHSEYLNVFFESGGIGVMAVLAGLGAWLAGTSGALRSVPSTDRLPYAAAIAAVAATAFHSFVDMDLRITSLAMFFAVLIGLGASLVRKGEDRRAFRWVPLPLSLATVASLVLLPLDPSPRIPAALASSASAAPDLLSAISLSPYEFRTARLLAASAQARQDLADADRWFEKAADLWPAHPELQREAGLWFWTRGDLPRSAKALRRLFEQQPGAVAGVTEEIWDPSRNLEDYESLLPREPRAHAAFACSLVGRGQWKAAVKLFERGCPAETDTAICFDEFASALSEVGQWGVEAVIRDKRLELRSDAPACAAAARAWSKLGAHDRALDRAVTATRIDPANARWMALKAEMLTARGDRLGAVEAWTQALLLPGADPNWRAHRAALYTSLQMHAAAVEEYRDLLRIGANDRSLTFSLAEALAASGEPAAARLLLDSFLTSHPLDSEASALRKSLGP